MFISARTWSIYFFHQCQSVELRIYTDTDIRYQYLVQLLQLVDFFVSGRVGFGCFLIDGGCWCCWRGCRGCWRWQCRHGPGARVGGEEGSESKHSGYSNSGDVLGDAMCVPLIVHFISVFITLIGSGFHQQCQSHNIPRRLLFFIEPNF